MKREIQVFISCLPALLIAGFGVGVLVDRPLLGVGCVCVGFVLVWVGMRVLDLLVDE